MKIGSIINGDEMKPSKETMTVTNPYNNEVVAEIALAAEEELNRAIDNSYDTFHQTTKKMPAHERGDILLKASNLLEERLEEFAETITKEAGKPLQFSRGEVERSMQVLRFAAEEAKHMEGEVLPMDAAIGGKNRFGFTKRVPLGVVAAITPFNFPLNLTLHKVAPAIAAGNTIILKPAEKTPLSAYKLVQLLHEAGLPKGALNLVLGTGKEIGDPLVKHEKIHKVTFTGSLPVGRTIRKNAGFKKVTLELGSNSPNILFEDADLNEAIPSLVKGSFAFSGQVCISAQRIYVHQNIYESFLNEFIRQTEALTIGDPMNEETDFGPMINEDEAKRAKTWIDDAVNHGATIKTGGERNGTILKPTIMTDVKSDMKIIAEEVFAPIVSVIPFSSENQVINKSNDSIYGLQAGIFTKDIDRAFRIADQLEMGGVWINEISTYRQDNHPYGGVKQSGIGREGVKYALEDMTEMKFYGIKLNG
ncbi:aldehyde dehydrogenase family protein [Halobacillus karajensis]|uniref:3-sulfolactaldehyde dehydrogenase n=1 Tax=Halobacillus karajensis TaxID=195088 RepID=A0A024P837_9BACI|nr:aldehyde dehydrogenase family protein [Halobacillus karajensis]CDQ20918.1 Succinate-semialdehyde dehydrogenase [NADP(+)] GabD [Halobacillus karajensis]CDQ25018.1 Succinate-semialdehyde dehydrogenase [NADP(+)] GabD [Halobacillus karajensis]CDQ28621.1 Succinate-semialdehyde dehydrogenase [NADP(+)] GabD [Halobacillus karajensis]